MKLPNHLLEAIKAGDVRVFYKSGIWRSKRQQILKRDNFECQRCKDQGKFNKAEVVHHIKHLRKFPELALDDENLLSVCGACHNILHPEKNFKANQVNKKEPITPERW